VYQLRYGQSVTSEELPDDDDDDDDDDLSLVEGVIAATAPTYHERKSVISRP
jgi:hypothetical protein